MSEPENSKKASITFSLPDESAMTALGAQLAKAAQPGMIVYLDGDLGAGKTTLVRGFLRAGGYQGAVKSPTFTVVETYSLDYNKFYDYNKLQVEVKLKDRFNSLSSSKPEKSGVNLEIDKLQDQHIQEQRIQKQKIYHFDLYRLEDPEELEYLGIRDYLDGEAIALIEWPEKGEGVLPEADLLIKITHYKQGRGVELLPESDAGAAIVSKLALSL